MPRFSTVVVCTSPRPILVSTNTFGKADYLRTISLMLPSFSSSSVSSPLRAFETFPRRDLAFISALQYPVGLVAKLIKSGSVSVRPESAERADGPVDPTVPLRRSRRAVGTDTSESFPMVRTIEVYPSLY